MTTNRTSRRAEQFDRALAAEGGTVDPAMAALVAVAGALAALPQRPAPAFRAALRTKLMAEAASLAPAAAVPAAAAAVPAATAPLRALPRLLAQPAMQVATGGLAAAIAVTGLGVGTSRSLPGDALYGLKQDVEGLQVGLAGGATAEAMALLEHAQTRLDEVRALLGRGDLANVSVAMEELDAELHSAVTRLLADARAGSRLAYDTLQRGLDDFTKQLLALNGKLPVDAQPALVSALGTLNVTRVQLRLVTPPPVVTHTPRPVPRPSNVTGPPTPSTPTPSVTGTVPPPPTTPVTVPPPPTCLDTAVLSTCLPVTPPVSVPPTPSIPVPNVSVSPPL